MSVTNQFLPFLPLVTARLKIRAYQPQDLTAAKPINQGKTVRRWVPSGVLSDPAHQTYIANNTGGDPRGFPTLDRANGNIVGEMTFHRCNGEHTWEIGWLFLKQYQANGYATEAARALLDLGFGTMSLHRIVAITHPDNIASWRVMEKIGMRREGAFRQCSPRPDGTWWDELHYAILADEWRSATNE